MCMNVSFRHFYKLFYPVDKIHDDKRAEEELVVVAVGSTSLLTQYLLGR